MNEKENKGKKFGVIIGLIAFAITFAGVKYLLKKDIASELKKGAIELNKISPQQIDNYTRLDSASSIGKTNFIYHYTLLQVQKSEIHKDTLRKYAEPDILKGVKEEPSLKIFRENNIIMDYNYYDKNGDFVLKISITPEMYK